MKPKQKKITPTTTAKILIFLINISISLLKVLSEAPAENAKFAI